jgi:alkylhydroperoxidase family enzyme
MDVNAAGGSQEGASDEEIAALADYATSPLFSAEEKLALELADAASQTPVDVSDALFARLREHFSEPQLVELAAIVALENFRSRFNRVFRVEPNGLYCPLPPRPACAGRG